MKLLGKCLLFVLIIHSAFFIFNSPVFAAGKTIYYFDASSYYVDRFVYCNFSTPLNPCHKALGQNYNDFTAPHNPAYTKQQMIDNFDTLMTLTSIQGLVNRSGPTLWVNINARGFDQTYWERFTDGSKASSYGFLSTTAGYTVVKLNTLQEVLTTFTTDPNITGTVEYQLAGSPSQFANGIDPAGNGAGLDLATTVAGADGKVINRVGSSTYDLIKSTFGGGVTPIQYYPHKKDAYQWAVTNYLITGKSNPSHLMYGLDAWPMILYANNLFGANNSPLFARDYWIMQKYFTFDVSVWNNTKPVDDPSQSCGDDASIFNTVLTATRSLLNSRSDIPDKMLNVWGFPSWMWKYYDNNVGGCGTPPPTDTPVHIENEFIKLISTYGAYTSGEGGAAYGGIYPNKSILHWGKLPKKIVNPPAPTLSLLKQKGYIDANNRVVPKAYIIPYMGDYEYEIYMMDTFGSRQGVSNASSTQWYDANKTGTPWNDPSRGVIPLGWGTDATADVDTFPALANYFLSTRSPSDYFSGAFGGPGYAYVNYFANNSTYLSNFRKAGAFYYSQLGVNTSPMITWDVTLNGNQSPLNSAATDAYASFSPGGIGSLFDGGSLRLVSGSVPLAIGKVPGAGAGIDAAGLSANILSHYDKLPGPTKFIIHRLTYVTPSLFDAGLTLARQTKTDLTLVDPTTFFYLLRLNLSSNGSNIAVNNDKASFYIDDPSPDFPATMIPGQTIDFAVSVRNDGWNSWGGQSSCINGAGCFRLGYGMTGEPGNLPVNSLPEPVTPGSIPTFTYGHRSNLTSSSPIAPGESFTFPVTITAPAAPGIYYFRADVVNEGNYWFETHANLPFIRKVIVTSQPATLPGDINRDGKIDILDLARIVNARTQTTINPYSGPEDVTGNSILDVNDLNDFLKSYTHL